MAELGIEGDAKVEDSLGSSVVGGRGVVSLDVEDDD